MAEANAGPPEDCDWERMTVLVAVNGKMCRSKAAFEREGEGEA